MATSFMFRSMSFLSLSLSFFPCPNSTCSSIDLSTTRGIISSFSIFAITISLLSFFHLISLQFDLSFLPYQLYLFITYFTCFKLLLLFLYIFFFVILDRLPKGTDYPFLCISNRYTLLVFIVVFIFPKSFKLVILWKSFSFSTLPYLFLSSIICIWLSIPASFSLTDSLFHNSLYLFSPLLSSLLSSLCQSFLLQTILGEISNNCFPHVLEANILYNILTYNHVELSLKFSFPRNIILFYNTYPLWQSYY